MLTKYHNYGLFEIMTCSKFEHNITIERVPSKLSENQMIIILILDHQNSSYGAESIH